jgi:FkbM family methyltransferase
MLQYLALKVCKEPVYCLRLNKQIPRIYLRPGTSDFSTFRQVFMDNELAVNLGDTPQVIVDGGANIGLTALYWINKFPSANIICIEPDLSNYEILKLNTQAYTKILALQCALWNENTIVDLMDEGVDKWGIQVRMTDISASKSGRSVKGIRIDTLMEEFKIDRIDLLKLDIEGAEFELFQSGFQNWLPKVKTLIIELHEHLRPGCVKVFENALLAIRHRRIVSGEKRVVFNLDMV